MSPSEFAYAVISHGLVLNTNLLNDLPLLPSLYLCAWLLVHAHVIMRYVKGNTAKMQALSFLRWEIFTDYFHQVNYTGHTYVVQAIETSDIRIWLKIRLCLYAYNLTFSSTIFFHFFPVFRILYFILIFNNIAPDIVCN